MLNYLAGSFRKIAVQCSHYEDGARWCDFCGERVVGRGEPDIHLPQHVEHNPRCPIQVLRHFAAMSVRVAQALLEAENDCHATAEGVPSSVWEAIDEAKEWGEEFCKAPNPNEQNPPV